MSNISKKIKIALLSGGISGEREVSLKTGAQIFNALDKNKYEIFRYDPQNDLKQFFIDAMDKKFDLVFPALHGPYGEDGKLQGMLDMIQMPYVFSNCLASALAMNKRKAKIIAKHAGLQTIKHIIVNQRVQAVLDRIIEVLALPIVVKPIELGSSVGMTIAKTKDELEAGVAEGFKFDKQLILEQFIKGRELTVAVMGNDEDTKALPVIEIIPKASDWFDYKAKYEVGGSKEVCPADIPEKVRNDLQEQAIRIYKAIGCEDLARADFIWDGKKYCFLEINTIPGMTQTSLAPQAAKAAGMEFGAFLDVLITSALKK